SLYFVLDLLIDTIFFLFYCTLHLRDLHSFPTRRSSDLDEKLSAQGRIGQGQNAISLDAGAKVVSAHFYNSPGEVDLFNFQNLDRSEEHTSELQSRGHLVCRLLLEKKKQFGFQDLGCRPD